MEPSRKQLITRSMGTIFWNGVLFRNPIVVGALGFYPVVAAGFGLKNAAALSILFLLTAIPSQLLMCFWGLLLPEWVRPAAALAATGIFYVPAALLLQQMMPGYPQILGMAAPLMACNSVLYARAAEYAPEHVFPAVLADSFGCSVGFTAVVCVTAAVRELWMTGGVWDRGLAGNGVGTGFDFPFAGFLLLGFLAAIVKQMNLQREKRAVKEG